MVRRVLRRMERRDLRRKARRSLTGGDCGIRRWGRQGWSALKVGGRRASRRGSRGKQGWSLYNVGG